MDNIEKALALNSLLVLPWKKALLFLPFGSGISEKQAKTIGAWNKNSSRLRFM
jgi:hypothetical protein